MSLNETFFNISSQVTTAPRTVINQCTDTNIITKLCYQYNSAISTLAIIVLSLYIVNLAARILRKQKYKKTLIDTPRWLRILIAETEDGYTAASLAIACFLIVPLVFH